jgi:hypothetical protein
MIIKLENSPIEAFRNGPQMHWTMIRDYGLFLSMFVIFLHGSENSGHNWMVGCRGENGLIGSGNRMVFFVCTTQRRPMRSSNGCSELSPATVDEMSLFRGKL